MEIARVVWGSLHCIRVLGCVARDAGTDVGSGLAIGRLTGA